MKEKVYLVDGSGYIFRAYFAVTPLSTKEGFPTNALFGFFRMLIKLLNQSDSQHVVMVFDTGEKTFRHKMYSEYKANRPECPEDLAKQMPYFREISKALGLPVFEQVGYEADDIIGALAKRLATSDVETVIISGDKDLMQLVGENVAIWDAMKDAHIGPAEVKKKFGVEPEKVVEVLALMGDSSDNIPGLTGVGPKTATQLIEMFGSVEEVINSAQKLRESSGIRNRKKISEQIELDPSILRLSRELVQIDVDMPLEILSGQNKSFLSELGDEELLQLLLRNKPDSQHLGELVQRFEFSSLARDLKLELPDEDQKESEFEYITVWASDFDKFFQTISEQKEFAFDLETTSLDFLEAELVGASFCWEDERAYYIPLMHKVTKSGKKQVSLEKFLDKFSSLLANEKIKKSGQNLKYDISVLLRYGVEVNGISFDSMLASYLLNPDRRSHNLTSLSLDYLGRSPIEYDELVAEGELFSDVEVEKATHYAAEDAHFAWLLKKELSSRLKENDLLSVFEEIEIPLVSVLAHMELAGVKIDSDLLSQMSEELSSELERLSNDIVELAGEEFNINSPKQLSYILFEKLGLPTQGLKKTKTGISTNSAVLEQLESAHALPGLILRYRMLHKLKSTYVDSLPEQISSKTDRLHSRFNQAVTATGRLSSSDPNLQNIPVRTEEGRRIREAFIADEGSLVMVADYSQVELRILADMSNDANLIDAFKNNQDIHVKTAREILEIPEEDEVSSDQRRIGKTMNFGIIYGMSSFRLAKELGIPFGVAKDYIENYFANYPGVKSYFDGLAEQSVKQGYVSTLFGRKRNTAEIDSSGRDRDFVQRAVINAPIQGTAADLVKKAMISIDGLIREKDLPLKMVSQVHDELVFECDHQAIKRCSKIVVDCMESVVELQVPLKVDVGWGNNWQEAHS